MSPTPFSGTLSITALEMPHGSRRQLWRLDEALTYHSPTLGAICVPEGFVSDLASIPPPATLYIDDDHAALLRPAVLHDWVYANAGRLPGLQLTRRQADNLLIEGVRLLGCRWDQRAVVWLTVRAIGWAFWGRNKQHTELRPKSV